MSAKIDIDIAECTSCKTCFKACFLDVIHWNDIERKPVVSYPEDCVWCFTCEINCPAQCITVIPSVCGLSISPMQ